MEVFKILRPTELASLKHVGATDGAPVDVEDGFIHFSTAEQVPGTLAKHFAGEEDLTLCACDAEALGDALRWEKSRGGKDFPHLYRALEWAEVAWTAPLPLEDGRHVLPERVA